MATPTNPNEIKEKENKTTVVPRNWATMFGLTPDQKKPDYVNKMFLTIEAWSPPKIKAITTDLTRIYDFTASQRIEGFKFFYPRDNIQESIKHTYSESSSSYSEALAGFRGAITKNLTAVVEASTGGTGGALTEEPHIFNKSERRTFSINIPLIAYDNLEKDIYEAIRFFRKNSYPRRARDAKGNALLNIVEYPSVFKIRGGLFDTNQPAKGSTFILEDYTIDYAPNVKSFMNGLPIEAVLTLGFTELNLLFGEDFDATPINVNIGESGSIANKPSKGAVISRDTNLDNILKPSSNAAKNVSTTKESLPETVLNTVTDFVKESKLARKITSLPETDLLLEAEVMVKSSSLYKKITNITEIDPTHITEIKAILRKTRGL